MPDIGRAVVGNHNTVRRVVPAATYRDDESFPSPTSNKPRPVSTSAPFFDRLVRNTYKVLLTRGMQEVCLQSVDPETNEFLRHFAR